MVRALPLLAFTLALAACGEAAPPAPESLRDPQVAQALDDPLMTDPDLSARNEAAAALTVESDFSLPVLPATPEQIARAKGEAERLAGGPDKIPALEEPTSTAEPLDREAAPRQRLAALAGALPACGAVLASSAIWAARLPAAFPVYPHGHTIDAAGGDAKGCKARTVAFATPVPRDDVIAFYLARARALEGLAPPLMRAGDDLRLRGEAGRLLYDVLARTEGDHTLVRLTTIER